MSSNRYKKMADAFKTVIHGAIGAMTFGAYHQFTTNKIMESNNDKLNAEHKYNLDRIEMDNKSNLDRIEMKNKSNLFYIEMENKRNLDRMEMDNKYNLDRIENDYKMKEKKHSEEMNELRITLNQLIEKDRKRWF